MRLLYRLQPGFKFHEIILAPDQVAVCHGEDSAPPYPLRKAKPGLPLRLPPSLRGDGRPDCAIDAMPEHRCDIGTKQWIRASWKVQDLDAAKRFARQPNFEAEDILEGELIIGRKSGPSVRSPEAPLQTERAIMEKGRQPCVRHGQSGQRHLARK